MHLIYRIEDPTAKNGLWYAADGSFCKRINEICPNAVAGQYPMPYDERHYLDGLVWYSAARTLDEMAHWFSREDSELLLATGLELVAYRVTAVQELEMEVLFCFEHVLERQVLTLDDVYPLETA